MILSTFSIVAYDPKEPAWGIAVASKFLAVGAVVPWAQAGAGAIATQSYANTSYGPVALSRLAAGASAEETLKGLIENDPQASVRQVGIVDSYGNGATYTGKDCPAWAGGVSGPGFAAQGNTLVEKQVVDALMKEIKQADGDLPSRLYAALLAADRAGGDRRGRQSAALLVVKAGGGYAGFNDRWVDYRVDDDPDPVAKLGQLLQLHRLYFGQSPKTERLKLSGEVLRKLQGLMADLGYYRGPLHGEYDAATKKAFEAFIGNENFEDRAWPDRGLVDPPVLDYLFHHFGGNG
ncbi:MAG: DUF1028 domain-containing protein [Chloroflexi bacterium]|nr:DUF1028 domain-containing protein [Chloroflexota bacterium]